MPMIRAMRMLNAVEAGTTSGAQLQTLLTDSVKLGEWNVLLGMRGQARRMAASSTTMTAVAASSAAMTAVAASSTAMTAVVANNSAMTAVASSSTAMAAITASSTAMAAVAASSTAMAVVAPSKLALEACWNSETALAALRSAPTALTALLASPYKQSIGNGNSPSNLATAMVTGKIILLQSRNSVASDTNYLATKYVNGVATTAHNYNTEPTNTTQMVAFQDIMHVTWSGNRGWYGDVVKVD